MNCPNQLIHVIRRGDNLYQLSRHYNTTVPKILIRNKNIDPYNLQVGTKIIICPGPNFNDDTRPLAYPNPDKQIKLRENMRAVWEQHVYWTRMLLISIAERLKDQGPVTARLLQNPDDIAKIFADYYSPQIARTVSQLLTEHLQIGAELIIALRDGKTMEADTLNRQWYINADKMADAFSGINPYYDREDIRDMLYSHLDLTKQEVAMRLAGNYPADIQAFNAVEHEALSMADAFSSGLMRQFPQMFD